MKIQSINQNSFKGYDARPLKGFFMGTNHKGLAYEMVKIGRKEGFKVFSSLETPTSNICGEYKIYSKASFNYLSTWAQDVWTFTNEKIFTSELSNLLEIGQFFNLKSEYEFNKHIAGGNLFIVNNNGEDELLIGRDSAQKMSTKELQENYKVEKIHIIPQMDYHLDLFIRPLDKNRILVADDNLTLITLLNGLNKVKKYRKKTQHTNPKIDFVINALEFQIRKFKNEILANELPQTNKIIKILNKAGFETIRVPGRIYETTIMDGEETFLTHDCNYMNANAFINKDKELVYITNKSNFDKEIGLTPDLIRKTGFSFENEFIKSLAPYIKPDKIYFIDGEDNYISKSMLKNSQGGIHCICAEVPLNQR